MAEIHTLTDSADLDSLLAGSDPRPVWLFKHSLICPISTRAWREFQQFAESRSEGDEASYHLIEIQRSRPLSKEIAERTGIRHESPQALLVQGGEVVWHASHMKIRSEALSEAVTSAS